LQLKRPNNYSIIFGIDADSLIAGIGRNHYGKILFEVKKLVESGKIKPLIFNWKQVALAHNLVESKGQKGKVVVVIE